MIELLNVTKKYPIHGGERTVLDNISFRVEPREKLGILGRNGSGKSTLIRILSGCEDPTSGTIHRGMSISWPLALNGGFQGSLTGLDNLRFICRIYNTTYEDKVAFVEEFAELGVYLREPISTYSSGMRARLAFAISMVVEFDCYLLDEVTAVGDRRFHQKCRRELFEKRHDRAMIMVAHDPGILRAHCEKAAVLVEGKLFQFPTIDEGLAFYEETLNMPSR